VGKRGPYRHRTLEERLKVHMEVMELRTNGKTLKEIAEALGISRRDVSYWFRVGKPSRTVYSPDLTPRDELAYLVGAYLGDGRTAGEQDKKVRFKVADPAFADQLNDLVSRVIGASRKPVTLEEGFSCVSYDAAVLYDFLQQPIDAFASLISSHSCAFLRGFFDAEGFASPVLNHGTRQFNGIEIGVANTNDDYLKLAQNLLRELGMSSRLVTTHETGEPMTIRGRTFFRQREVHQVRLEGKTNVLLFFSTVGFTIPKKKEKLSDMIEIMNGKSPSAGYVEFTSMYELVNRRWQRSLK
jgi:intein-encoded DNA endonuclease-like protein